MVRRRFATWIVTFTFLSVWAVVAHAQLPDGCSSADLERSKVYTSAAVKALLQEDNAARFVALLREMESGLSKACRAALNREQPVRVRCTADERELVLQHYHGIIAAALVGNMQRLFALFENLEASLSRTCWLAANQHDDPRVRKICSAAELDMMASYVGPATRATQRAMMTGDISQLFQLVQEMTAKLSPECSQAVDQAQKKKTPPPKPSKTPMTLPGVNDHGGGTLSAPGLGACTPSGCMAF